MTYKTKELWQGIIGWVLILLLYIMVWIGLAIGKARWHEKRIIEHTEDVDYNLW